MKETTNIKLRALKESDIWILHGWINDPEVIKYTSIFHPVSEMEQKEWFSTLTQQKNRYLLGIEAKEGGKLIGTCGFNDVNHVFRKAELFLKICEKSMWNRGYGTETLELLMDFGFSDLNLRRIWLRVLSDNERAIKLYEKAGFLIEGILKDDHFIQGNYKNVVIMAYINR
jgi:RimJ/RimL family protein N-acetyltransferase